jgi:AcrR family transcriptional regulator
MPRVSPQYKERRRTEILDAARRCFARDGFAGATLQDVFAESGLSAGAVYGYFQSKHELVLAIAEDRHAEEREALAASKDQDAIDALKALMQRFFDAYLAKSADTKRRISLITWAEALFNEEVRTSVRSGVEEPRAALASLLRRGQKDGSVRRNLDVDAMTASMVAMLQGLVLQRLWDPSIDERAVSKVCGQLIESLRA